MMVRIPIFLLTLFFIIVIAPVASGEEIQPVKGSYSDEIGYESIRVYASHYGSDNQERYNLSITRTRATEKTSLFKGFKGVRYTLRISDYPKDGKFGSANKVYFSFSDNSQIVGDERRKIRLNKSRDEPLELGFQKELTEIYLIFANYVGKYSPRTSTGIKQRDEDMKKLDDFCLKHFLSSENPFEAPLPEFIRHDKLQNISYSLRRINSRLANLSHQINKPKKRVFDFTNLLGLF